MTTLKFGDLFAGGGGTTTGALLVTGVKVPWAVNHSKEAIELHAINHPETEHYREDIRTLDITKLCYVDEIWASMECTNYSIAKGGKPRDPDSRSLPWEMPRYIKYLMPDYFKVENVKEFMMWGRLDENGKPMSRYRGEEYLKWVKCICGLGYVYDWKILNCADYGEYTSRRRYFGVFSKIGANRYRFPPQTHDKNGDFDMPKWKACKDKIDLTNHGKSIFGRKKELSPNTMERIAAGMRKYCPELTQFIMQYYGTGGFNEIDHPLKTITTKDRHALVTIEKEKEQFLVKHYSGKPKHKSNSLNSPSPTITTAGNLSLITTFITDHCHVGSIQDINEPLKTQLTRQTKQFIAAQFNPNGNPGANVKSIDEPLHTLTAVQKTQFITTYFPEITDCGTEEEVIQLIRLIIKKLKISMRFLDPDELGAITGFPDHYFDSVRTKKLKVWLIGNAVPIGMAKVLVEATINTMNQKAG